MHVNKEEQENEGKMTNSAVKATNQMIMIAILEFQSCKEHPSACHRSYHHNRIDTLLLGRGNQRKSRLGMLRRMKIEQHHTTAWTGE